MARDTDLLFKDELLRKLIDAAYDIAFPQVNRWSRALAYAMKREIISREKAQLYIPHYWAVYVNDGRRAVSPIRSIFLVWFRNPEDDPRFSGRVPVRKSDVRRLTPQEWKDFLKRNREAAAEGQLPPMIVARHVGPVSAKKFFDNDGGMRSFADAADSLARREFSQHVKSSLGDLLNMKGGFRLTLS